MKLKNHPYAQCEIFTCDSGSTIFRSYETNVICITADGDLFCTGLYSRTTLSDEC